MKHTADKGIAPLLRRIEELEAALEGAEAAALKGADATRMEIFEEVRAQFEPCWELLHKGRVPLFPAPHYEALCEAHKAAAKFGVWLGKPEHRRGKKNDDPH